MTLYLGHTLAASHDLSHFVPAPAPEDIGKHSENPSAAKAGEPSTEPETADDNNSEDANSQNLVFRVMPDPRLQPMDNMAYGTSARPPIKGFATAIVELPVELMVDDDKTSALPATAQPLRRRRLIFIGDVHGQRSSLDALLEKVGFSPTHDHLVLTGDLVNKGPDSAGVVKLAMEVDASAVRGSNDDRVLLAYEAVQATKSISRARGLLNMMSRPADLSRDEAARKRKQLSIEVEGRRERARARLRREEEERLYQREEAEEEEEAGPLWGIFSFLGFDKDSQSEEEQSEEYTLDLDRINADLDAQLGHDSSTYDDDQERAVAASLSPEQYRWLSSLPAILHIGSIVPVATKVTKVTEAESSSSSSPAQFEDVVVVHGGLVPGLSLASQDPMAVMTMRSLVHPADELRRERARDMIEYDTRLRSRGYIRPTDYVYVSEQKVDRVFHKLQHAVYGPDLQHPLASIGSSSSSQPALLTTSPSDLVLLPVEAHFSEAEDDSRMPWAAIWNQVQHAKAASEFRTTVIYGHDAKTGLAVPPQTLRQQLHSTQSASASTSASTSTSSPGWLASVFSIFGIFGHGRRNGGRDSGYTFGLDSGCVYGNQLTALIVEAGSDGSVQHYIEQVDCPKAS
ncbi:serine/threonine-protein phosphatase family [Grosmannia clavigera kw1407]|uniref:Serine/threonine-protein phosphatase family n=1 Tax=Grosmannia clavigera (strain kw1407 / UAMH 11150) TaxID=655863 RepID=F0XK50_GROCL|nr:serine/threonine-protein phosphatase family [Grosmannia clavigera kw1407]EFX01868.1 serine/threonine-protein phosphatase family [Grosmannia clavigera kw1407]